MSVPHIPEEVRAVSVRFGDWLGSFLKDYQLGKMIRKNGISVMRINDDRAGQFEWSACNAKMEFDYGHSGKWGNAKTALEAVKSVLPNVR